MYPFILHASHSEVGWLRGKLDMIIIIIIIIVISLILLIMIFDADDGDGDDDINTIVIN